MGAVNWLAVALAALAGTGLVLGWYRWLMPAGKPLGLAGALGACAIAAVMLGHNFARIGVETLGAKPWLYWMMAGGFALWFAAPVLFVALGRQGVPVRVRLSECAAWIAAFLVMGTAFYLFV